MIQFPLKTKLASDILSEDVDKTLEMIPKEDAAAVCGIRGNFFCDAEGNVFKKEGDCLTRSRCWPHVERKNGG